MQTLEGLKKRISATKDLRSIVSTMKSLSAVSINQYERATESLLDYTHTIETGLQAVFRGRSIPMNRSEPGEGRVIAIVVGSDHGLVGKFNKEITSHAQEFLRRLNVEPNQRSFLAVGKRIAGRLSVDDEPVDGMFMVPGSSKGIAHTARAVLVKLDEVCQGDESVRVVLFHNSRTEKSLAVQRVVKLLPVRTSFLEGLSRRPWPTNMIPHYTMEPKKLLSSYVREFFFSQLCRALAESLLSEHATRLATMQAAEKNIDEHLDAMNGQFQQRRQTAITEELMDVISGCEALQDEEEELDAEAMQQELMAILSSPAAT